MKAIDTWRATSHDKKAIEQVAAMYGGTPVKWTNTKATYRDQWEVITDAPTVQAIISPADSLSVARERWTGKGYADRRCAIDGSSCTLYRANGESRQFEGCRCEQDETPWGSKEHCKFYSRLNVLLPCCQLGGLWRMESKGQTFAHEAPGMIELIGSLSPSRFVVVDLTLTARQKLTPNGMRHFIVPTISLRNTITELAEQQVALTSGIDRPLELEAGDLDIVDAEIVED